MPKPIRVQGELENILEEIETGTIIDEDDLEDEDLDLLREYCGEGDDLENVLDTIRGSEQLD